MPPAGLVSGEVCVQQVTPGGEVVGGRPPGTLRYRAGNRRRSRCARPRLPACAPLPGEALTGHRLVMLRAVIVMFRAVTGQLQ